MTNEQTLERLHFAVNGIRQLAAGTAHSQLDMRAMKVRKTGRHGSVGPLDALDSLAVHLAAPYLQALADVEIALNSPANTDKQ